MAAALWATLLLPLTSHAGSVQGAAATAADDGRRLAGLPAAPELAGSPASKLPTDLEILIGMATGGARRHLEGNLLAAGPEAMASLAAGVGPASDPEVARFQAYIGTLAPGLAATYFLMGLILVCTTFCCVCGCVYCCCLALLPTEVCVSLKPICCL
jgi:hypothetical protein